jgi:hypothetical protein
MLVNRLFHLPFINQIHHIQITNRCISMFMIYFLHSVPSSIPHRPHIIYSQFQPVYRTVHTSPANSPNQYTTPSTHHLQPVPPSIPHRPHITYNQFQPVFHNVHTSPTASSNRYTTPSTRHPQLVPSSTPHRPHVT